MRDDLRADIEGLAEAKTFEDKKRYGKSIYYKIESFTPVVKQLADAKKEQTQRNEELANETDRWRKAHHPHAH